MIVDRAWVERNIGFDPVTTKRPRAIYANKAAAGPNASLDDIQRDIIDFDSEGPEGAAFKALTAATGLSKFTNIPWPSGFAPQTAVKARGTGKTALPQADVLVVTWTVDEGHALSRVLTPGKESRDDYVSYTHNFATISQGMSRGSPAVKAGRLGAFWMTTIAGKTVLVFKSDSHLSQDTDKHFPATGVLPNAQVWRQIITETQPKLVISTGTSGGIGADFEVGDVVVSAEARFEFAEVAETRELQRGGLQGCGGEHTVLRRSKDALRRQRRAIADRQYAPAEDCGRRAWRLGVVGRHDRLFRLRFRRAISSSFRAWATPAKWATRCSGWSPTSSRLKPRPGSR